MEGQRLDMHIFFFRFFSIIGFYKTWNILPCAMQQVLIVYLFHIQQCAPFSVYFIAASLMNYELCIQVSEITELQPVYTAVPLSESVPLRLLKFLITDAIVWRKSKNYATLNSPTMSLGSQSPNQITQSKIHRCRRGWDELREYTETYTLSH